MRGKKKKKKKKIMSSAITKVSNETSQSLVQPRPRGDPRRKEKQKKGGKHPRKTGAREGLPVIGDGTLRKRALGAVDRRQRLDTAGGGRARGRESRPD